jgi:hypothetical protein
LKSFTDVLHDWQVFYATLAAACATLTGLLFVALSLNADGAQPDDDADRMAVARQTFAEFLLVLMVALVFLIPHQVPPGLGVALLALGLASSFSAVRQLALHVRARGPGRQASISASPRPIARRTHWHRDARIRHSGRAQRHNRLQPAGLHAGRAARLCQLERLVSARPCPARRSL